MAPGLTELEVVPFRVAAYNKKMSRMEYYDPNNKEDYVFISGKGATIIKEYISNLLGYNVFYRY